MNDYYIKDRRKRDRGLVFNLLILLVMLLMVIGFILLDVAGSNKKKEPENTKTTQGLINENSIYNKRI